MDFVRHLREMVEASRILRSDSDHRVRERGEALLQAARNLVPLYVQIMANGNAASFTAARNVLELIASDLDK